jgi:hypothetical protein
MEKKAERGSDTHGLRMDHKEKDNIVCRLAGNFPRLQDSYYQDTRIYLDGAVFRWQDLLEPRTQSFYLFENMDKDAPEYKKKIMIENHLLMNNKVEVKEQSSQNPRYTIHELARELMFTYAMSMLSRYDIMKWKALMAGEHDNIMWTIEGYLKTTQSFFPNLIFNEIHGERYFFYPESRAGPDQPTF